MYYAPAPQPDALFQGDILANIPMVTLPGGVQIYRAADTPPIHNAADLTDAFLAGPETVVAQAHKTTVMVLTQTCDIEQREFVTIAPVLPMAQITNRERRRAIIDGRVNYRFWLPASDTFAEAFVELTIFNSLPKGVLTPQDRILSLSDAGRHHLADTIHRLFCRPFHLVPPGKLGSE